MMRLPTPSSRWRILVALLVLSPSIGVLGYGAWNNYFWPRVTENEVRAGLDSQFPPGTPRTDVVAWLRSTNQHFDYFQDVSGGLDRYGNTSILQTSEIPPDEIGGVVRFTIRDTERGLVLWTDIEVYLFFDKSDRLIKHVVMTEVTGL
jgi:hypothetical protein